MLIAYCIPILCVWYYYSNHKTVSSIICNECCNTEILYSMIVASIFTLLYEYNRNDKLSLAIITALVTCNYGVICIDEASSMHKASTVMGFLSMLLFMIYHCCIRKSQVILLVIFGIQCSLAALIAIDRFSNPPDYDMFNYEVLMIANFLLFYITQN